MRNKPIQADQLIPTSSTPPPEAGFYRIDRHAIGVVGDMYFRDPDTQVVMPVGRGAIPFPNFAPRLLASLVASSTAACTSGVVTVTATAHGITATIFDGMQFYYPGSPSLAAGWYSAFARTSVDEVTFSAPGAANFTSESINAGSAFTSEVTFFSATLSPNALSVGNILSIRLFRSNDAVSSTHLTNAKAAGNIFSRSSVATPSSQGAFSLSGAVLNSTTIRGVSSTENVLGSSALSAAIDINSSMEISLTNSVAAAGMFICIPSATIRIE